ncbi:MAG: hypothetical protein JWO03_1821 [Bacteroidetes bacterium]|nr:hypothetical protein [Bacteroidota bacterium]
MTTELSFEEFMDTMSEEMIDVTETTDATVDIWPYVTHLVKQNIVAQSVLANEEVEIVYMNEDETFEHVLLPTDNEDVFITIVVDLDEEMVIGHYRLDLTEQKQPESATD